MIASLSGVLESKGDSSSPEDIVIDVNGVGYRVAVSLRAMARLPQVGERTKMRIRTVVREDALDLYGFISAEEEKLFQLLTSVSHVGPKMAMTVLSGMDPSDLAHAIASSNLAILTKVHGVGKKTAERIIVELKDKVESLVQSAGDQAVPGAKPAGQRSDLVSALVNLGYKPAQAQKAAELAQQKTGAEAGLDVLIREALRVARG